MSVEIRPAEPGELSAVTRQLSRAFLGDHQPALDANFAATTDWSRTRCAYADAELVGTSGAFGFELAVPGATTAAAGTTIVSVRSDYRRQGVLARMMRAHLEDSRDRGEALAVLWASESGIYGRFGYGWSTDAFGVEIDTRHAAFGPGAAPAGRVRMLEAECAPELLPPLYERLWRDRPGHFARDDAWWEHRRLADFEAWRGGFGALRFAVVEDGADIRGYVQYRVKEGWTDAGPDGSLQVVELQGLDAPARTALWRHVLDVDLVTKLSAWNQPSDGELPWLLADPRRAVRTPRDSLWLNLVDVGAALAARRYRGGGDRLAIGVRNRFWSASEGVFVLEAGAGGASCKRRNESPDLELDASTLGALYLGGHSWRALARAGLVRGQPDHLERADALFEWDPMPWCPEMF